MRIVVEADVTHTVSALTLITLKYLQYIALHMFIQLALDLCFSEKFSNYWICIVSTQRIIDHENMYQLIQSHFN